MVTTSPDGRVLGAVHRHAVAACADTLVDALRAGELPPWRIQSLQHGLAQAVTDDRDFRLADAGACEQWLCELRDRVLEVEGPGARDVLTVPEVIALRNVLTELLLVVTDGSAPLPMARVESLWRRLHLGVPDRRSELHAVLEAVRHHLAPHPPSRSAYASAPPTHG